MPAEATPAVAGRFLPLPSLRQWRQARALSQADLAAAAGLDTITVYRAEGRGHARPGTVRKLAAALGLDPTALQRPYPA